MTEPDPSTVAYRSHGGVNVYPGQNSNRVHADPDCDNFSRTPDDWIEEKEIAEFEDPEFCGTCCPEGWGRDSNPDVDELLEAVDDGEIEAKVNELLEEKNERVRELESEREDLQEQRDGLQEDVHELRARVDELEGENPEGSELERIAEALEQLAEE